MRRSSLLFVCCLALSFAGSPRLMAQTTTQTSLTVSARVLGHFSCTVNADNFDFGDLGGGGFSKGGANVVALGRNASNVGEVYENTAGSITWSCRATPAGIVDVALVSAASDHTGGMALDDLAVRIPPTAGGTSTGFQPFASQAPLITGLAVGHGADAVEGYLDLRLTVRDLDPVGPNTWVVRLRATAHP